MFFFFFYVAMFSWRCDWLLNACFVLTDLQDVVWNLSLLAVVPVCYLLGGNNKCLALSVHVLPGSGILSMGRWVRLVLVFFLQTIDWLIAWLRGVALDFIFQTIKVLKPRSKGVTENIKIISSVSDYLKRLMLQCACRRSWSSNIQAEQVWNFDFDILSSELFVLKNCFI